MHAVTIETPDQPAHSSSRVEDSSPATQPGVESDSHELDARRSHQSRPASAPVIKVAAGSSPHHTISSDDEQPATQLPLQQNHHEALSNPPPVAPEGVSNRPAGIDELLLQV